MLVVLSNSISQEIISPIVCSSSNSQLPCSASISNSPCSTNPGFVPLLCDGLIHFNVRSNQTPTLFQKSIQQICSAAMLGSNKSGVSFPSLFLTCFNTLPHEITPVLARDGLQQIPGSSPMYHPKSMLCSTSQELPGLCRAPYVFHRVPTTFCSDHSLKPNPH